MKLKMGDFIVDTMGCCFICLTQMTSIKVESGSNYPPINGHPYSLQRLSKYLKITMGNVFNDKESTPPKLLAKVEGSMLKAELCEPCINLMDKFSRLHQQLERIEMELISSVIPIQSKMMETDGLDMFTELKAADTKSSSETVEKLHILKVLRNETIGKCIQKVNSAQPRVKIKTLTPEEFEARPAKQVKIEVDDQTEPLLITGSTFLNATYEPKWSYDEANGIYLCKACSKRCNSLSLFHYHYRSAHLQLKYPCGKCPKSFASSGSLAIHDATIHLGHTLKCPDCNKCFTQQGNLKKHRRKCSQQMSSSTKYECGLCSSQFSSPLNIWGHYTAVHGRSSCPCTLCGKLFTCRNSYRRHHRRVHIERALWCHKCDRMFKRTDTLMAHIRRQDCGPTELVPAPEGDEYRCQLCQSSFTAVRSLQRHYSVEHLQK